MTKKNNAIIDAGLNDLLKILDARATVSIYEEIDGEQTKTLFSCVPVYELLTIEKKVFRYYEVTGIIASLTTQICVKKIR